MSNVVAGRHEPISADQLQVCAYHAKIILCNRQQCLREGSDMQEPKYIWIISACPLVVATLRFLLADHHSHKCMTTMPEVHTLCP